MARDEDNVGFVKKCCGNGGIWFGNYEDFFKGAVSVN
jgi:hypothetical protein